MVRKASPLRKLPQVRACGFCQKVGHNKSTCPDFLLLIKKPTKTSISQSVSKTTAKINQKNVSKKTPPPVNFFVHHVYHPPTESPHKVDLKNHHTDIWEQIQSIAPEQNEFAYQTYHLVPKLNAEPKYNVPSDSTTTSHATLASVDFQSPVFKPRVSQKKPIEPHERWGYKIKEASKKHAAIIKQSASQLQRNLRNIPQHLQSHFAPKKLAIALVALMVIFILPGPAQTYVQSIKSTKDTVANQSTEGFMALQESTAALLQADIPAAEASTVRALNKFGSALQTLESKHRVLQKIVTSIPLVRDEVTSRQNILIAGQKITLGNTYILKGLEESKNSTDSNTLARLTILTKHLQAAVPNYEQALTALENVKSDTLPVEYQSSFKDYKQLFASIFRDFKNLASLGDSLQEIFGGEGMRRYLLIFQNPDEIRATGGFMGSFAELDVKDGNIVKFSVPAGGTYDIQGQLSEFVEPPTPLLLSNKRWEFQDANWFPDFSKSAEKITWFYRHAGKGSVDGVIAINSSVLTRLLSLMGPLTDTKRNITISDKNAISTIQTIVETGPEKQINKPKQILSDLAPQFIDYFKKIDNSALFPVLVNLKEALDQKEIQAYFPDSDIQNHIRSFGWAGTISPTTKEDYLLVVNSNIQGQKSDAKIKQAISHQAVIEQDGSIVNNVVISRQHTGTMGEKFYGQPNIDYIRLYVPEGSTLIRASGFTWPDEKAFKVPENWTKKDETLSQIEKQTSIDENSGTRVVSEFNKTSFGNWVITEPGKTSEIHFSYKLPFKISNETTSSSSWFSSSPSISAYHLIVQRQSGSESSFESQIIFPEGFKPVWKDGAEIHLASNGATIAKQDLKRDSTWSFAMEKTDASPKFSHSIFSQ